MFLFQGHQLKLLVISMLLLVIRLLDKLRKNITLWKKKKVCLFYLLQKSYLEVQRCAFSTDTTPAPAALAGPFSKF